MGNTFATQPDASEDRRVKKLFSILDAAPDGEQESKYDLNGMLKN